MKRSVTACILVIIPLVLLSQVTEEWVVRYDGPESGDDNAYSLALDSDGNIFVAGESWSGSSGGDYCTIKYNSSGEEVWVVRYDGPGSNRDWVQSMTLDDIGNVYLTGNSEGEEPQYQYDYCTIKYNSLGEEQWVARYDGPGNNDDFAKAVLLDDLGNVYVTGKSCGEGPSISSNDCCTIKYNSSGGEEWVARYDGSDSVTISDKDDARCIALDGLGNVYVTGSVTIKYSSSGEEEWAARHDSAGVCQAYSLDLDNEGNVYITGKCWPDWPEGSKDAYCTIKFNSSGEVQWCAYYDGPESDRDEARSLKVDSSGNVYVTGSSEVGGSSGYDYCTIKYSQGTGIAEGSTTIPEYHLEVTQLTPNPSITYDLPSSQHVILKVYDVSGQMVGELISEMQSQGAHTLTWDAEGCSDGVYFIRLQAGEQATSARVVVTR